MEPKDIPVEIEGVYDMKPVPLDPVSPELVVAGEHGRSRSFALVWGLAALHCLGAVTFGYNTSITSPSIGDIDKHFGVTKDDSGSDESTDSFMKSLIVSAILVGSLIGALGTGTIADRYGRLNTLMGAQVINIIGAIICAFSVHVWMLIAGRFILGFAVGAVSVTVPMMVTEIAPSSIRGQIGVLNQLGVTVGLLIAYILGALFAFIPKYGWRISLGFVMVFAVVHLVGAGVFLRVESPKWLMMQGREEEARKALEWLLQADNVNEEIAELKEALKDAETPSLLQQIKMISHQKHSLGIALGLMFVQQITGVNALLYYLTTFFENAGMTEDMANYMSILIGGVNVIMTLVSVAIVDKAGRKVLLLASLAGMTVSLLLIGVFSHVTTLSQSHAAVGSVVFCMFFIITFAIGMGAVVWPVINEIFPNETRALAGSLSLATNWGTNLLVSLCYLPLVSATSMSAVFWGFSVLSAASIAFVYLVVPETKGRSVEEIVKSMQI